MRQICGRERPNMRVVTDEVPLSVFELQHKKVRVAFSVNVLRWRRQLIRQLWNTPCFRLNFAVRSHS